MAAFGTIRPRDQNRALHFLGFTPSLHHCDLGGLVLVRNFARPVSNHDLDRQQDGQSARRHTNLPLGGLGCPTFQSLPRTRSENYRRSRSIGSQQHVCEPTWQARIEDRLDPAGCIKIAGLCINRKAGWRLHPAVCGEDPES